MTESRDEAWWREIDQLLLDGKVLDALKANKCLTGCSLYDAVREVKGSRLPLLKQRFPECFPEPSNKLEEVLARFEAIRDPCVAIQAMWDGDSDGWYIHLSAVAEAQPGCFTTHGLAFLRFGSDLRLFNGHVPPWPEAAKATELGEAISAQHGIPFYFPSPHEPDDECPEWWERHLGVACRCARSG